MYVCVYSKSNSFHYSFRVFTKQIFTKRAFKLSAAIFLLTVVIC